MKNNRSISFIVITLIYIISLIVGIITFNYLNYDFWFNLLISDILATVVVFTFSILLRNASVYDPYWSVQPIVIVLCLLTKYEITSASILVAIAICFWGIRLTANWAYTFKSLNHQDWRYTMLKKKTKVFYPIINFIGIHLVPTLVVYSCVLPACYLIINEVNANIFTFIFCILAIFSASIQGISDIQMHKYRKNKATTFIREGLWKYSRHPNYLGEIMMWWNIGLLSVLTLNNMSYLLIGAILNTCLFMFVSIPLAENKQSVKEGYEEYKKETRMLLPFFK